MPSTSEVTTRACVKPLKSWATDIAAVILVLPKEEVYVISYH